MGEINNRATSSKPEITDINTQGSTAYNTGNDWAQQMYRVKECGMPSTGFLHPPIVREPPAFVQPSLSVELPNKFVNELYIKYPFLIPKSISPKDYKRVGQVSYTSEFSDLTTYQVSYGNQGYPEPPELVAAKGLALPEPPKPPVRIPGAPYMALCRRPLPSTDAVDFMARSLAKKTSEINIGKRQILPKKNITEYEDNYNSLVRYWQRKDLFNNPDICVPRKHTLPPD